MTGSSSVYIDCTSLGFDLRKPSPADAVRKLGKRVCENTQVQVFKTHDVPSKDFDCVCSTIPDLRLLTVSRDFKDVVISRYFYCRYYWPTDPGLGRPPKDVATFLQSVANEDDQTAVSILARSPVARRWAEEWQAFEGEFFSPNAARIRYAGMLDGDEQAGLELFTGYPSPSLASFEASQRSETIDTRREGPSRFNRVGKAAQWKEWFNADEVHELDCLASGPFASNNGESGRLT